MLAMTAAAYNQGVAPVPTGNPPVFSRMAVQSAVGMQIASARSIKARFSARGSAMSRRAIRSIATEISPGIVHLLGQG
jgi:hypothetical protein